MRFGHYILLSSLILGSVSSTVVSANDLSSTNSNTSLGSSNSIDASLDGMPTQTFETNNTNITSDSNHTTMQDSISELDLPETSYKTNFSTVKSSSNVAKIDLIIVTALDKNDIEVGDTMTLNLDSTGIQYSTLKLVDGSTFFSMTSDSSLNKITLTALKNITYSGTVNVSVTANPTKNSDNTGQAVNYPLSMSYSRDKNISDVIGSDSVLTVQNNKAGQYDSFGPHLQGSLNTQYDSSKKWFNNYVGYDNYKQMYSYDQEGMMIRASLDNFVHDLLATNIKWGVTLRSETYHSSSTINQSTLHVYYGKTDMTDQVNVTWDSDGTGFVVSLPDYKGYDSSQWSASFIANTNGNTSHVDGSSYVTANDASTGLPIEAIKNENLVITLSSADVMFRYYATSNGSFLPHISVDNLTIYDSEKVDTKEMLALADATDQVDGDLTKNVVISDDGGFNSSIPGIYTVIYSVTNSAGNTSTASSTFTVLEDQTSISVKDSTIDVGTSWQPKDNFISAKDKEGHKLDLSNVQISGIVDSDKVGSYIVTYSTINANGDIISKQATITVDSSTSESESTSISESQSTSSSESENASTSESQSTSSSESENASTSESQSTSSSESESASISGSQSTSSSESESASISGSQSTSSSESENASTSESQSTSSSESENASTSESQSTSGSESENPSTLESQNLTNSKSEAIKKINKQLPETGTEKYELLTLIGELILLGSTLFIFKRKK